MQSDILSMDFMSLLKVTYLYILLIYVLFKNLEHSEVNRMFLNQKKIVKKDFPLTFRPL